MKNKFIFISVVFVFFLVSVISVGYSAFSTTLSISGEAFVRREADIRITDLKLYGSTNGAAEKFSSEYSKNLTSMYVSLPNVNSTITYQVTVTNKTNKYFSPNEIVEKIKSNSNVSYTLNGIEAHNVYQGNSLIFYITFTTSSVNQNLNLTIQYDFKTVDSLTWIFPYSGSFELFSVPYNGKYLIELWGAQGKAFEESRNSSYSLGGYTSGYINLNWNTPLYVYVGEAGDIDGLPTFNGGGRGGYNAGEYSLSPSVVNNTYTSYGSSGGGATDVRLVGGDWNNFDSLKSRIMVAAGGGGDGHYNYSGQNSVAGGLTGYKGNYYKGHGDQGAQGFGGSQISGGAAGANIYVSYGTANAGAFGIGGDSFNYSSDGGSGGGGGGYFGGGAGGATGSGGGGHGAGGGSSFISGHNGCVAISESSTATNIVSSGGAIHYSNYKFTDTVMIDGAGYLWTNVIGSYIGVPTHDGSGRNTGNQGDGYAKITLYP